MAYGLKYTIPFKDIDNNGNVVEIYQDGFVGISTELIATDQPATHKYERQDNEDITTPIMSTTFTVSFYSTELTDFRNFFSYSDREFLVVHKFEGEVVFKGYLLNDITGEPFQDPPYPVVVTATDGLAQLKEVDLVGPEVDTELGSLIFETLNRLQLDLDIEVCNDLYEGLVMDNTKSIFDQAEGEQLLIQAGTFTDLELNAYDFLQEICRSFGWILLQKNGRWLIQRPIARNITGTTIYVHSFDTGLVIDTFPNNFGTNTDITDWNAVTVSNGYKDVYYGNGVFAATFGPFRAYSLDGITWNESTPVGWQATAITFGNGLFVAVGFAIVSGVPTAFAYSSNDGINWTSRTPAANNNWVAVSYGNGLFVAVAGNGASNRIMTSPDGITWTARSSGINPDFSGVAYGNGIWVAIAEGSTGGTTFTSTDGLTWVERATEFSQQTIIFANGLFTTGNLYSLDGLTWVAVSFGVTCTGLAFGNGYFVAVTSGGANRVLYSTNAINWTSTPAASVATFNGISFGDNTFVAVAEGGTNKINYLLFDGYQIETIADQTNANTTWIPVSSDQILQYQRPIKKLTVKQGGLGQSIIANGEEFNEASWTLDGYYKPKNWTINIDPANVPQIFPENIPSQATWDDEKGVSWDFRFINSTYTVESQPVFLDNAGLIIDFDSQVGFEQSNGSVVFYFKHKDVNDNITYLTTEPIVGQEVLTWSSTPSAFGFSSTRDNDIRTFKMTSFILPSPGFLSVEIHGGVNESMTIKSAKLTPTYLGQKNPTEVSKIYETSRAYTSLREDQLVFSDLCITSSKNWLKIGGLPAIVFVEKSLADTPDIIRIPSGAVSQVNQLTSEIIANTLEFTDGFITGTFTTQYTAASGYTIESLVLLKGDKLDTAGPYDIDAEVVDISSTQKNVTITGGGSLVENEANVQITVTLKDIDGNTYQVSTYFFQYVNSGGGTYLYDLIDISFNAQATEGSYSPTLRDCYARNVLTIYNALSYRLEGSFRRNGNTFGNGYITTQLIYTGYSTVRLQVVGWEYDLATRVARITFGQVPTAYVYPIN